MKIKLIAAFGIGYVLGARAGRERYEEIRRAAERVQSDPRVREAADRAETFAKEAAATLQDDDALADAVSSARETAQHAKERVAETVQSVRGKAEDAVEDAPAVKDAVDEATSKASDLADDAASKVKDVAQQAASKVDDPRADDAASKVADVADDAVEGTKKVAEATGKRAKRAADDAADAVAESDGDGSSWPPHPDAHVAEPEDEVVYTTGPDDTKS